MQENDHNAFAEADTAYKCFFLHVNKTLVHSSYHLLSLLGVVHAAL